MSYIDQNLMPGEQVIHRAKLHWSIFVGAAVLIIVGLLFMASSGGGRLIGAILLLLGVLRGIRAVIAFTTTEFALTSKRVIGKSGLVRRRSLELLLPKVESVIVDQPLMGRVFGYGTIVVGGTGGTKEPFSNIAQPLQLRQMVQSQISTP